MLTKRLAHINIGSDNLNDSEHFYCDVLGMKKTFEFIKNGNPYGFYVEAGEMTFIEVFINEEAVNRERPLLRHLCFEVEDIDAAIKGIRDKGWEITDKKMGCDKSWQAWVTDPSGVRIEMMQYTPESSQFTGAPCNVNW